MKTTLVRAGLLAAVAGLFASGCGGGASDADAGPEAGLDGGTGDAGHDAGPADAGADAGTADGGDGAVPACTVDADCSDGAFCNGMETCRLGACVAGTAPTLDDGVACTADSCDEATDTVVHAPRSTLCDDGAFCNGAETCDTTGCHAGTPPVTDDGIACTTDSCDETADTVVHAPSDTACDDGMACTADSCVAGTGCAHPFVCACATNADCNDGNACTDDTCTAGTCGYTPNTAPCDDGLYCNGSDVCAAGSCGHVGDPCAGGAECARTCVEATDTCFAASGTACTADASPCTNDVCDGSGACTHPNNTAPCGDGLYCDGADVCAAGTCTHAGNPCAAGAVCNATCDEAADSCAAPAGTGCTSDGNACTTDACNGSGACAHPPNTAPCDDGLYCNGADVCAAGSCTHAGSPCAGGATCNDACNEAADDCLAAAGSPCTDDGVACTADVCNGTGTCTHTSAPETACANHVDDDCDGLVDCLDPGCATLGCGPGGATCSGTTCLCPGGATESSCTNGIDDDCDGATDCADSECASGVICSCTRTRCMPGSCGAPATCLAGTCGRGGIYGFDAPYGGTSADQALGVVATPAGYYAVGSFGASTSFGGPTRTSLGSTDGFVVALGPTGAYRWDVEIGGARADSASDVAADASGNVVVVGYIGTSATASSGFVQEIGASGTTVFTLSYPGVIPIAVTVGASGNIFVTGYFTANIDFGGGLRTVSAASPDIFVLALTSGGGWVWDREYDGGGGAATFETGTTVATDASGNVYVGGDYASSVDFGGGATPVRSGGAFVVGLTSTGAWRWDRSFGGGQPDDVGGVAVTQLGDVVVGGSFGDTTDFGGGMRTSSGFVDAVLFALGTDGSYRWDHEYGSAVSDDRIDGVGVDCAGNVVATGMFQGAVDFGGGARTSAGGRDVFTVSVSRTGAYRWDRALGGSGADRGLGALLTGAGRVAVVGSFSSVVDFGAGGRLSAGGTDAFVLELAD